MSDDYGHYPPDAVEIKAKVDQKTAAEINRLAAKAGISPAAMASILLAHAVVAPPSEAPRICAYDRCGEVVVGPIQKRYCCASHRKMASHGRRS